jgi:hypothetical protein
VLGNDVIQSLSSSSSLTQALDNHARLHRLHHTHFSQCSGNVNLFQEAAGVTRESLTLGARPASDADAEKHLDLTDRSMTRLYLAPYALEDAAFTTSLLGLLKELKDQELIEGHVFWRDRPIQHCNERITLGIIVRHDKIATLEGLAKQLRV